MYLRNLSKFANRASQRNLFSRTISKEISDFNKRTYSKFEPEYLKLLVPDIPEYPLLNVQVKGYDFPPLERFSKYVVKKATLMGIDVVNSWATPGTVYNIKSFSPGTQVTDCEYKLTLYERNVQLADVPSTFLPIFLQIIQNCLPEGVQLSVHPHENEHEEYRYIPDLELEELTMVLEVMAAPKK